MKDKSAFADTNVLIYALAKNDPRAEIAAALLEAGCQIGVQNLNEFVAVAMRKLAMPWKHFLRALHAIRTLCPSPAPLTVKTHDAALQISKQTGYHIYDALVIASALESGCRTLYSEDMQDGQQIAGLTIRNPFRSLKD